MVMGALGLLAVPPYRAWSLHPRALKQLLQVGFASIMLFVLLGVDPASDVIAHLGGFCAGVLLAIAINGIPGEKLHRTSLQAAAWMALAILFGVTFWFCARGSPKLPLH
jgi:hypothetical protein